MAAPVAGARCHRSPATGDARLRRDARSRASRVDIARVQAIEYLDAALGADRRQLTKQYVENYDSAPKLAERIWQSIYDLSQGFIYAYQTALEEALRQYEQRALEAAGAAAVRAPDPLLRHRRQASRVPLRTLDPRQVGGIASHVPARRGARHRSRGGSARQRRPERHAVDGRAGIHLRPADPSAQHRQHVAAAARLGHGAACARGAGACRSMPCRARSKDSSSTSPADRALAGAPATTPVRCCATSTRRRSPSSSTARSPRCARPRPPTRVPRRRSTSSASRSWKKSRPSLAPNLNAELRRDPPHRMRGHREGAHRAVADLPGAHAEGHRHRRSPTPRRARADRGVRRRRRLARSAARARRARFARRQPVVVLRPDVAGQGPQRRRPAHRGVRRHRPEPRAGCARRRPAVGPERLGAGRRAPA